MALHLVTGYSGKSHITSADQGALNAATFGRGSCVLNVGKQFAANVITNNTINVLDGEAIMQGRHIRLESGAYEEVTIENGTQEYFRNDLICIRYTKDSTTGIEEAAFVVIKGTPDASSAVDPAYQEGNILDGILTVDFPLYRVPLSGLNIGDLVALFEVKESIDERIENVSKDIEANATNIKKIANGTTPAGNALKLNGLTLYRDFSEIDSTFSNQTPITNIIQAMPHNSRLEATVWNGSADVYPVLNGILEITKTLNGYVSLKYTSRDDGRFWTSWGQGDGFGGWIYSADGGNAKQLDNKNANEYALLEYLTKAGLKNHFLHATKWGELSKTTALETTFFSAWGDGGEEMPMHWGGGIIIPSLDPTCKFIIYVGMVNNTPYRIYLGYMKFTDATTYTIQWNNDADTVDGLHASDFALSKWFLAPGDWSAMECGQGAEKYRLQLQNGTVKVYKSTDSGATWSEMGTLASHADLANYLPLDGSVPMSGNLALANGVAKLEQYGGHTNIIQYNKNTSGGTDSNNSRMLSIFNASEVSDVKDGLKFRDKVDGVTTDYTVLHTGNSAKVLVSETPLTAEGSIRVW